jgi:hypothetical protein
MRAGLCLQTPVRAGAGTPFGGTVIAFLVTAGAHLESAKGQWHG